MDRYLVAALVGSLLCALPVEAQESGTITGRVVESTSLRPLVGAAVSIDGTQMGTLTRADGGFLLTGVPAGTHTVSANLIGYGSQQQQVTVRGGESTNVQFSLQPQAVVLEEVVATGYSTQRREAITGSVATLRAEDANVGVISNANELMQGRIAGLQVTLNNGEPGAGAQVRIRGGTSISASNEPLYVIDGVPINNTATEATGLGINSEPPLARSPLNLINPNDIESITVLKDAAAAAIYGSRAANGVVLIQTKGGAGATGSGVEYEGYVAMATPYKQLDVMTGGEYRSFVQGLVAKGDTRFADRLANLGSADTDWEDELTESAVTHNHNLTFYGGSENTQYRASLNYMDQQGVVINNGFERIQGRLKASHEALGDRLRLGANVNVSHLINDYLPYENTGGFEGAVFTNMVIFDPTRPVRVTDAAGQQVFYEHGTGRQEQRNPVAMATDIADDGTTTRILGNTTASLVLLEGVTAEVNLGLDRSEGQRLNYLPRSSPVGAEFGGRARQVSRDNTALTLQTYVKAVRSFGDAHDVDFVGGYEYADYYTSEFGAEGRDFATDAFGYNSLGGGNVSIPPFSWVEDSRLVSFFGRANYGFANKYFLTGVLRREGSSRFGTGNKWAVFPALSASWRLTEEGFMQGSMFSDLRLRAGWGKQGNQAVPPYASLVTLGPGGNYSFGDNAVTGIQPTRNANPNLKWEETSQINVAVDYALFEDRLAGTIEFYRKSTDDLLLEVPVPQPALVPTRLENVGKTESQGIELSLDALLMSRSSMSWRSGLVFSTDRNEIVSLGGDRKFLQSARASGQGQSDTWTQRLLPGEAMGTFFGPEYIGVDANGKQLFRCSASTDCVGGQTTSPSGDDYVVLGNANPDFTVGWRNQLNVGSFDVSAFVRAELGQEVFNNTSLVYATKGAVLQGRNFLRSALDDGVGLEEPAIYSSRWIEDGSFVRVQNVTLGYTFDASQLLAQAKSARAYVSIDNLLLLTDYTGYDPEVHTAAEGLAVRGVDYLNYPRPRTVTTGIRLSF